MRPLEWQIARHYLRTTEPFQAPDSPALRRSLERMLAAGLLRRVGEKYEATEFCRRYIGRHEP